MYKRLSKVYYFNPTCELAVANGSFSYQPPLLLQEMERDMAILPFVFCKTDDFVLVENKPSQRFLQSFASIGFEIPVFSTLSELEGLPENSIDEISPWGWSPAAHFKLKNVKNKCREAFWNRPIAEWRPEHRKLYERKTSLDFLHSFLGENKIDELIDTSRTGIVVHSVADIEQLLLLNSPLVLKAPLSSSGRGIQLIRKAQLNNSNKQWISGVLKQQKYLIAEPFLNKISDFSFQFRIKAETDIEFLGLSFFETNSNGQYTGTILSAENSIAAPAWYNNRNKQLLLQISVALQKKLAASQYAKLHRGFLGIDAMTVEEGNRLIFQPCVEINCRTNMGVLAKQLERKIHPDSCGKFKFFAGSRGEFQQFITEKQNLTALKTGKLYAGVMPLTEPTPEAKFGAYLEAEAPR